MRYVVIANDHEREMNELHGKALERTGFWGSKAAGCLFLAKDTGRLLFAHRSAHVVTPNTWGTWGGAIDPGENPVRAVMREIKEETGYLGQVGLSPLVTFSHKSGFKYYNFLAIVPEEFEPVMDWETQGFKWVTFGAWPTPLHSGAKFLLSKSGSQIKSLIGGE